MRCHSLPSTVAVKRRQKRVYGEKFLLLVHSIHVGSGWSAGIVTPRSMGLQKTRNKSISFLCVFHYSKPFFPDFHGTPENTEYGITE